MEHLNHLRDKLLKDLFQMEIAMSDIREIKHI